MLILRKPWNSQPQDYVAIDRSTDIGASVQFALCGGSRQELTKGQFGTVSGTISTAPTANGLGIENTGGSQTNKVLFDGGALTSCQYGTGDFWALWVVRVDSFISGGSSFNAIAGKNDLFNAKEGFGLYHNGSQFNFQVGTNFATNAVKALTLGRTHVVFARRSGTSCDLWLDGVKCTSSDTSSATVYNATSPAWVGQDQNGNRGLDGVVSLFATGSGAFTNQAESLCANPWKLFQPSTLYIPASTSGAGSQALTPALYSNAQTFYTQTVSAGAVTLAHSLYSNSQAFYTPAVTQGAQDLTPALYSNAQSFYVPVVTVGGVSLTPSLYTNSSVFYSPVVVNAGQILAPDLFSNSQSFYAPTVTTGSVTIAPDLFSNTGTFYSAVVSDGTSPFVKYFDVLSGRLLILRAL